MQNFTFAVQMFHLQQLKQNNSSFNRAGLPSNIKNSSSVPVLRNFASLLGPVTSSHVFAPKASAGAE